MRKVLSTVVVLLFSSQCSSMNLESCKIISGTATVISVAKEVVDFSSDKFLSNKKNGENPGNRRNLYKYILLDAAVWDSWKSGVDDAVDGMPAFLKYPLKVVKGIWDFSSFSAGILVGTECFYLFRLTDSPTEVEAFCAIAGAVEGSILALKGVARLWSYLWTWYYRSDENWSNGKVSSYLQRRQERRSEEKDKDEADVRLF